MVLADDPVKAWGAYCRAVVALEWDPRQPWPYIDEQALITSGGFVEIVGDRSQAWEIGLGSFMGKFCMIAQPIAYSRAK